MKKRRICCLFIIVMLMMINSITGLGAECENLGSWETKANMLTERYFFGVETIGGKIYVIGGNKGDGDLSSIEEYDAVTDSWISKTPMSVPKHGFGTAVVDGKLYVMGGYHQGHQQEYSNTLEEYDPITDSWTRKSDMPTERTNFNACVVNGKIYAIGGANTTGSLSTVEEYDPITDSWTTKADMIAPRHNYALVEANGKLYALGGRYNGALKSAVVEVYDPATNIWTSSISMTEEKYALGAATIDDKIYIFGGNNGVRLNTVEEYDIRTKTWTTLKEIPTAKSRMGVTVLDGKIYVIGGIDGNLNALADTRAFTPTNTSQINAPTNLTATASSNAIALNWDAVADADSYNILRSTTSGTIDTVIASNITTTTYTDTNVTPSATYYYVVRAIKNGVKSDNSNVASAMVENNVATLQIKLSTTDIYEYKMTMSDVSNFIKWYTDRENNTGLPFYIFDDNLSIEPYTKISEYIIHDKIVWFKVKEYLQ